MQQYINDIPQKSVQPPLEGELLTLRDHKIRKVLEEINEQHLLRRLAYIFRYATVSSLSLNGGIIRYASTSAAAEWFQAARVGDKVIYGEGGEAMGNKVYGK